MLPSVSKKLEANEEMLKKSSKKKKKKLKKQKKKSTESESGSSSDVEVIKKKKKKKRDYSSQSSKSSMSNQASDDEWIEKKQSPVTVEKPIAREDWLSGMLIPTFSSKQKDPKKDERQNIDSYDPKKSSRELNPFWKNGGDGLPSFQKPKSDSDDEDRRRPPINRHRDTSHRSSGWRKRNDDHERRRKRSNSRDRRGSRERRRKSKSRTPEYRRKRSERRSASAEPRNPNRRERSRTPTSKKETSVDKSSETSVQRADFLTDQQMNELGAKIVKAEIMGNDQLAEELKEKLEKSREYRNAHKNEILAKDAAMKNQNKREEEHIMLTKTNSQGITKPLSRQTKESDLWGGRAGRKKGKKVETHSGGERVRYFADDDKYDIKQMVRWHYKLTKSVSLTSLMF